MKTIYWIWLLILLVFVSSTQWQTAEQCKQIYDATKNAINDVGAAIRDKASELNQQLQDKMNNGENK